MSLDRKDRPSIVIGWAVVGGIVLALASAAVGTTLSTTLYGVPVALSFVLAVAHAAAIPFAIPRPAVAAVATAVAVTALALVQTGGGHAPWPWAVTTLVTHTIVMILVGAQARTRVGVVAWLAAVAGTIGAALLYPRGTDEAAINLIIASTVSAFALGLGIVAREWRSIRAQLVRERAVSAEEHERRVVAEEKTRIARELHDVVAHSMSIINVQASSAVYRHRDVPAAVAQEFDEIAAAARGAMSELRGLLGVLRDEGAPRELAPQPGLADIPALIEATQRSGVDVSLVTVPSTGDLDADHRGDAIGLVAYRIVQEALSNAIRHAPGSSITVTCRRDDDVLVVSIVNSRPTAPPPAVDAGHGLVGMRERATSAGGSIEIGPAPDGGFAVVARLPLRREES